MPITFGAKVYSIIALFAMAAFLLPSCGKPGVGSSTEAFQAALSRVLSPYLVLDIPAGTIEGRRDISDLATNPAYRNSLMVFRLVLGGAGANGAAIGTLGAGSDAPAGTVALGNFYCAVFETTQGQWQLLDGTTPWTTLSIIPAGAIGGLTTDAQAPAFGLSQVSVETALQRHNGGKTYRLTIPTDSQWEYASRGGTSTVYWWGNDPNSISAAQPNAVVMETAGTILGPRHVGQRLPNPFGLFDMQGNVWELTHTGQYTSIRGGSWNEPLAQARSANVVAIDRGTAHALVGVRLILVP